MNGNSLFVDTNVLLYVLGGDAVLKDQINHKTLYISFITELELLSFSRITDQQSAAIRKMLKDFMIIPYSESIKELIIQIRREHRLKLPDAIVAATALDYDMPLITADKSFSKLKNLNVYLYKP